MDFQYSDAPQRSPEWFDLRRGKVTASRLEDWMAVSKAKNSKGQPLKARLDYEKELMFERQFGVSYNNFVTEAMQDGIDLEDFAVKEWERITGLTSVECGCWYNDLFVASPDRIVVQDESLGILEAKVLRDASFTAVLTDGIPDKHWKQVQGQLFAGGYDWCDYIALNLSTKKVKVIRVEPDKEFFEWLELIIPEKLVTAEFDTTGLYDIEQEVPQWSDNNLTQPKGQW